MFSSIRNTCKIWYEKASNSLLVVFDMNGGGFGNYYVFWLMKKICYGLLTCTVALGGASVGIIVGAIKGQTTESGFVRGAVIGSILGAISAVQLLDVIVYGDPFSKVAFFHSMLNGKFFAEWVTPALLKAYQWQISNLEASLIENLDTLENNGTKGLSQDIINSLPKFIFFPCNTERSSQERNCIICLEDLKKGECTRMLASCSHSFHLNCIDKWLIRHGSCPICRTNV